MFTLHFFLTVILITITITAIQWYFIGFLFHKQQALTPSTWRKESNFSYAISTLVTLYFAFLFTAIFSAWKNSHGVTGFTDGALFGIVCWLSFSIPFEIGTAVYVNYSRMFVLGKCISSFFEFTIAGIIASLII